MAEKTTNKKASKSPTIKEIIHTTYETALQCYGVVGISRFDAAIKDAVFTGDRHLVDVDVHLGGDDLGNLVEHAYAVDATDADGGLKVEDLVHVPLDVEDAVSVARLQFGGHRTGALVDLNLVLVVDIAEGVVAGDGVTAAWELVLLDILLGDEDGLLAVELLGHDEELLLGTLLLFLLADERHVFEPARLTVIVFVLAVEFVDVFLP